MPGLEQIRDVAVRRIDENPIAQQMAGAQIELLINSAKKYPRDVVKFRQRLIDTLSSDPELAEQCFYSLPRKNKVITGPSVRFAELVASTYGNLWTQVTPVAESDRQVTVRAVAWDVESNLCLSFDVVRRITDSKGNRYNDDMITLTTLAASSIAFRNVVLRVVPSSLTQAALDAAKEASRKKDRGRPLDERRRRMFDYFESLGVGEERILQTLGVESASAITEEHLITMQGYANAIRSEGLSVETVFGANDKHEEVQDPRELIAEWKPPAGQPDRKAKWLKMAEESALSSDDAGGMLARALKLKTEAVQRRQGVDEQEARRIATEELHDELKRAHPAGWRRNSEPDPSVVAEVLDGILAETRQE